MLCDFLESVLNLYTKYLKTVSKHKLIWHEVQTLTDVVF